jgi:hypothetical protein
MRIALLAFLLSVLPGPGWAESLDTYLHCAASAHQFITALRAQQLIDTHPVHVEDDAINTFWPAHDTHLSAFAYDVFAVIGYQQDDPLFVKGKGQPIEGSLYGVVVVAGTAAVAHAIQAAGSSAYAKHAGPFLTAIVCRRT